MNTTTWHILSLLLLVAVATEAVVLVGLMRAVGALALRIGPTRLGEVEGGPAIGSIVTPTGLSVDRPTVILFMSPDCTACKPLVPLLPLLGAHFPEVDVLAAVIGGNSASRTAYAEEIGAAARLDLGELERDWEVTGTPFAVGVSGGGVVRATGVVNTLEHLEALAEEVLTPVPSPDGIPAGNEAPPAGQESNAVGARA
jgi:thiol-disulfide isomerase/thioredoxin